MTEKKESVWAPRGEVTAPIYWADRMNELMANENAVHDLVRTLSRELGDCQTKRWKLWTDVRKFVNFPKEEDGFQVWYAPGEGGKIIWKLRKESGEGVNQEK